MILISHRGNITGRNTGLENKPNYINAALEAGFDVEIDVWHINDTFYLGHDEPQYKTNLKFLQNSKIWGHAKNSFALLEMLKNDIHCFFHNKDDYTLTSLGIIWTRPNTLLNTGCVCVLPENGINGKIDKCYGICSDNIINYK